LTTRERGALQSFIAAAGSRLDGSPFAAMLDVDGTLAPIAPTPGEAAVPAETRRTLERLAALPGVHLALVSGRSASDAWKVSGVDGAWVIGNHGYEIRTPEGELTAVEPARPFERSVADAARQLEPLEREIPGAMVENKRWTLSVHYRRADSTAVPVMRERVHAVAASLGLRVMDGKKIFELRPPVDVNKGTATVMLAERIGALRNGASAMYAGDDRTDEDAFRALRARHAAVMTVHIRGDDPAATTEAEVTLDSTGDLRAALDWVVERRMSRG